MRALVIIALLASTAHAEIVEKGVRTGANLMSVSSGDGSNSADSYFWQPGATFGVFGEWAFNDRFGIQIDALISNKRVGIENCFMKSPCDDLGELDLWYLELPILARVDLLNGKTKLHIDGGPQLMVALGGKRDLPDNDMALDDVNALNPGIALGGGVEIAAGPGAIAIDARFSRSLGDKVVNNGAQTLRQGNMLLIAVGYAFP